MQLILPLCDRRSITAEVDFVEETAKDYRKNLSQEIHFQKDQPQSLATATIDNN